MRKTAWSRHAEQKYGRARYGKHAEDTYLLMRATNRRTLPRHDTPAGSAGEGDTCICQNISCSPGAEPADAEREF